MTAFTARHVERTHAIRLHAAPRAVFPLFSPLGERHWAAGWDPRILHPSTGEPEIGLVFTTRHADDPENIWTIAALDAEQQRIEYVRVAPGEQLIRLAVRCADRGDGTTEARVTYACTALSERGNAHVAAYTDEHHRQRLAGWERAINDYLRAGATVTPHGHPPG